MIKKVTKLDIIKMKDKEGLLCIGAGGDLQEWVEGINGMMVEEQVTSVEDIFTEIYTFKDGELTNLLFVFPEDNSDFNIGRLAMVRLENIEWMKWLSDYIDNNSNEAYNRDEECFDAVYPELDPDYYEEPNYVVINGKRNGYSPEQCGKTLTVGELIDILSDYDDDDLVYISNDNGYTYGSITKRDIYYRKGY